MNNLGLFLFLFIFSNINIYANEKDISFQDRNDKMVQFISENQSNDTDTNIKNFFEENSQYKNLLVENLKETTQINIKGGANLVINKVSINENEEMIFYEDGSFSLSRITAKPLVKSDMKLLNNSRGTAYVYGENQLKRYSRIGIHIYTITISANFAYDGQRVWMDGSPSGNYVRHAFLNPWQVSNWEVESTNFSGEQGMRAYSRGNFHMGIEYQGSGFIIDEIYEDVRVSCNYNGTIFKN